MSKIITINPELFKRTKKLISPKTINKTLINRIREKKKEQKIEKTFDESNNFLSNILKKHPKTLKVHKPLNNYTQSPITKSVEDLLFKPDSKEMLNINYKIDTACLLYTSDAADE